MGSFLQSGLLIIFSSITGLAEGMFIKKYNSRHTQGGMIFTSFISLFSMLFFVVTNTDGWYFPNELWLYAVIAGILYCTASFLTFVALSCGSFTMSMLIISYSLVIPIGYGILFLNEKLSLWMAIGLIALMISLFLLRHPKSSEDNKKATLKWLICIVISFFGNGMFTVITRMQQIRFNDKCSKEYMIIALSVSAVTLFLIGVIKEGKSLLYMLKYGSYWAALAGTSNGITNGLGMIITMLIPISLSSPLRAGTRIILSFFVSVLIYREKLLKRQVAGVALGALALVLLNIK